MLFRSIRDWCVAESGTRSFHHVAAMFQSYELTLSLLDIPENDPKFEFWHYLATMQRLMANFFSAGVMCSGRGAVVVVGGLTTIANHQCGARANAANRNWSLRATRGIRKDDQILVSYISDTLQGPGRGLLLETVYGIRCHCPSCCNREEFRFDE